MTPGVVVVPAADAPSGGHVYNDAVLHVWPGTPPDVARVPAESTREHGRTDRCGHARTAEALASALRGREWALVDGLLGCHHPEVLAAAHPTRVVLLVHLPLPDETGLDAATRQALAAREHAAIHAAWRVVATSRWACEDLRHRYGRDVHAAPPGVAAAPLARGSDPPCLLTLASFTPRKNHIGLVTALGLIADQPWRAVLAGPGEATRGEVRAAIAQAGLDDRIEVLDAVTGARRQALWDATDLLVLPSLAETYGLVVTEAIARGIPAVVPAGTGAVEALTDAPVLGEDLDGPDLAGPDRGPAVAGDTPRPGAGSRGETAVAPTGIEAATMTTDGERLTMTTDGQRLTMTTDGQRLTMTTASDIPGEHPGLAVDTRDAEAFAEALRRILSDPPPWRAAATRRRATLRRWASTASILADVTREPT